MSFKMIHVSIRDEMLMRLVYNSIAKVVFCKMQNFPNYVITV